MPRGGFSAKMGGGIELAQAGGLWYNGKHELLGQDNDGAGMPGGHGRCRGTESRVERAFPDGRGGGGHAADECAGRREREQLPRR